MTSELTPKSYLRLLEARVAGLRSVMPGDRSLPIVPARSGEIWLVKRSASFDGRGPFENQPDANKSLDLANGGLLELFLQIRRANHGVAEVTCYRIAVCQLPPNDNHMTSLRYDKSPGQPRREWDDELGDNPQHPWRHLHLNFFDAPHAANDLRLPTGEVDPIVLLTSFDHWYCNTYDV